MSVFSTRFLAASLTVGLLLLGGTARTDDKKAQDKPGEPPIPRPGPEHALLKQFEGTWDATVKIFPPGQPPAESKGTEKNIAACGGLWQVQDFSSEMMGMPFQGHGVLGYDSTKKKYIMSWVDSMSTYMMPCEGSFDAAGKVMTMTAEAPDMTGKMTKYKMVSDIKDRDTYIFTMSTPGKDGKDNVDMVITYKRKK